MNECWMQTNKHTNKQTNKQTNTQKNTQTNKYRNKKIKKNRINKNYCTFTSGKGKMQNWEKSF
jgi:hypothetical protein